MKIKKTTALLACVMMLGSIIGCGGSTEFDKTEMISVISREEGSGTRGAFVELFGVEQEDANGNKVDNMTAEASITNNTSVMMTSVIGDANAIGYISLGSLNESVKALKIDGAKVDIASVKSGEYKIARPFNIATKPNVSEATKDFINFIMSSEGQAVIEENDYISVDNGDNYVSSDIVGKIVITGSSSVSPVVEKLKEAYIKLNPNVQIEIQTSDSSTGVTATIEGICDIGMASRGLKETELSKGIESLTIAMDGIAVIVNKNNTIDELSSEQVRDIYLGNVEVWEDVIQ